MASHTAPSVDGTMGANTGSTRSGAALSGSTQSQSTVPVTGHTPGPQVSGGQPHVTNAPSTSSVGSGTQSSTGAPAQTDSSTMSGVPPPTGASTSAGESSSSGPPPSTGALPPAGAPPSTGTPPAGNSNDDFLSAALSRNAHWAASLDPAMLKSLSTGQKPQILWIGCSDSRVPAEQLLDLPPGSIFVHRNIANILHSSDTSSLAVIDYAVNHLHVAHIFVCGHIGCGGVAGAMDAPGPGLSDSLNLWLNPAREVRMIANREIEGFRTMGKEQKMKIVVERNVQRSLGILRQNPSVVRAMVQGKVELRGLVYDVGTGKLAEVKMPVETEEEKTTRELCFGMTG